MTDTSGSLVANSTIELDPFGGETNRTSNNRQSHVFTSYERDVVGMDEAGARKYHGWWSRFDQPDPTDSSYNHTDPQSFNRYAYVGNDPVNRTDASGLAWDDDAFAQMDMDMASVPNYGSRVGYGIEHSLFGSYGGTTFSMSPGSFDLWPGERDYEQRVRNARYGGNTFSMSPNPSPQTVQTAVADCIRALWGNRVSLTSLTPSQVGQDGSASFTYARGRRTRTATVTNDVNSYSAVQLGGMAVPPVPAATGITFPVGVFQGVRRTPYGNYTANDRQSYSTYFPVLENLIGKEVETQIHELGNSIHLITGRNVGRRNPSGDRDSGQRLGGCVAGKLSGGK